MLAIERRKKIWALVEEQNIVRVSQLSTLFSVTEETIRRDLEKLEEEKKVIRQHGGAVKLDYTSSELHFSEREIRNVKEKAKIAEMASQFVNEGDKIMLDASTTATFFARNLPNIRLIVVTNSIQVVNELVDKDKIDVICTGGRYSPKSHSFIGPLAERALLNYHVNKLFISCTGVTISSGVSDTSEMQAILKNQMVEHANEIFLMMDSSKVNKSAFAHICEIEKISTIITDSNIDSSFKQQIEKLGVTVLNVDV